MFKFKKEVAIEWGNVEQYNAVTAKLDELGLKYIPGVKLYYRHCIMTITYWGNRVDELVINAFSTNWELSREVA